MRWEVTHLPLNFKGFASWHELIESGGRERIALRGGTLWLSVGYHDAGKGGDEKDLELHFCGKGRIIRI